MASRWSVVRGVVPVLLAVTAMSGCRSGTVSPPDDAAVPAEATPSRATGPMSAAPGGGGSVVGYRPPSAGAVIDAFRPPPGPFAAGNRGLEYDTDPGSAVAAIGDGTVVFAGSVGATLHVTVHHPDGLRSSYSYLASIAVASGERVAAGQAIGLAGDRLHLGVRAGDAYLDPASLFGRDRVRLVPVP